jgi:hypothetical protein
MRLVLYFLPERNAVPANFCWSRDRKEQRSRESRMLATFSFEARLSRKLFEWQMSADAFGLLASLHKISGVSKAGISRALSGTKTFANEVAMELQKVVSEVDALNATVAPLKLDLKNPTLVYGWLQARRDGTLKIEVKQVNQ